MRKSRLFIFSLLFNHNFLFSSEIDIIVHDNKNKTKHSFKFVSLEIPKEPKKFKYENKESFEFKFIHNGSDRNFINNSSNFRRNGAINSRSHR